MCIEEYHLINNTIFSIITRPYEQSNIWTVFCPGTITGSHVEPNAGPIVEMARKLATKNIGTIRFDYAGKGDSFGDCMDFTYETALADTRAVINFLKEKEKAASIRIFGKGGGAYVAGRLIVSETDITHAFLMEPILSPRKAEKKGFNDELFNLNDDRWVSYKGVKIYGKHTRNMLTLPPLGECISRKDEHFQIYIYIAKDDEMAPWSVSKEFCEKINSTGARCILDEKPSKHDGMDSKAIDFLENNAIDFLSQRNSHA